MGGLIKKMKDDMTYYEVEQTKLNIRQFILTLQNFAEENGFTISQSDKDFFSVISKHIVFYKYMYEDNEIGRYYKVLISDCYYCIISLIKHEYRYMYVNQRSIIENYLRLIVNKSVEQNHITEKIFEEIKSGPFDFSKIPFSLIKNEYATACGYIHGGKALDSDLSFNFNECLKNEREFKDKNKYFLRMQKVLKALDYMLITIYKEDVNGAFHRRKTLLEYLLGKSYVEILFN